MAATTLGKVLESLVHPRYADKAYSVGDTGLAAASDYFGRHGWDDFDRAPVLADFLEERGSPHADIVRRLYQPGDLTPESYKQELLDAYSPEFTPEIRAFPRFAPPESLPHEGYGVDVGMWDLRPEAPRMPNSYNVSPWVAYGDDVGDRISQRMNNFVPDDYIDYLRGLAARGDIADRDEVDLARLAIKSMDPKNLQHHHLQAYRRNMENPFVKIPLAYAELRDEVVPGLGDL